MVVRAFPASGTLRSQGFHLRFDRWHLSALSSDTRYHAVGVTIMVTRNRAAKTVSFGSLVPNATRPSRPFRGLSGRTLLLKVKFLKGRLAPSVLERP